MLITGGVAIDGFNRYQDLKFTQEQRLADSIQRQINIQNFNAGVQRLNQDIARFNAANNPGPYEQGTTD